MLMSQIALTASVTEVEQPQSPMPLSEDGSMPTQDEDALHNSEERIRLILDSATEAICGLSLIHI